MSKYKPIIVITGMLIFFSCSNNRYMKVEQANTEIQGYLDKRFNNIFKIDKIDELYGVDLYKHQIGFKVWLVDTAQVKFGPIFFEKNKYHHGWITFCGSDIEKEYHVALDLKNK